MDSVANWLRPQSAFSARNRAPMRLKSKITRCTYLQCMPRVHLHDLWTNTCGLLLVGVACAFGMKWATKCEKESKVYVLRWKGSRMWARFRTAQNERIWSFLKTTTWLICFARLCCSHSNSLFSMQTSRPCGCIYAVFSHQAPSSSSLPSQFLPFWCRDNETASVTTALKTLNLLSVHNFL